MGEIENSENTGEVPWYEEDGAFRSSVMLYGAPNTGKTLLSGQLAEQGFNLLWFDLENGHSTLNSLSLEAKKRIKLISIPDTKDFPVAIETMLKVIKGGEVSICKTHGKAGCLTCKKEKSPVQVVNLTEFCAASDKNIVVIDSLTQLADSCISHITKSQGDDYKYDWDDYRKQGTIMGKFLSYIQQMNYNLICTSHECEAEMEDGRKKLVPVSGTTTFSRNTAKCFDNTIYCEIKNKKHCYGSSSTYGNNIVTGSRAGVEIEKLPVPSLAAFFSEPEKKVIAPKVEKKFQSLLNKNK